MPTTLPPSVREHFGEAVAEDFAHWLDEYVQENAVERDEYRKVLSRLDVIDERFEQVDQRFESLEARMDERFEQVDQRFDRLETRMDDRFESMDAKLDRMNDRILSMTRWLIGLVALFGSLVTALLAVAQFG